LHCLSLVTAKYRAVVSALKLSKRRAGERQDPQNPGHAIELRISAMHVASFRIPCRFVVLSFRFHFRWHD
jgi:hypothetical protein